LAYTLDEEEPTFLKKIGKTGELIELVSEIAIKAS